MEQGLTNQNNLRKYWPQTWTDDHPVLDMHFAYLQFRSSYNWSLVFYSSPNGSLQSASDQIPEKLDGIIGIRMMQSFRNETETYMGIPLGYL